jgi:hypothetical protein
MLKSSGVCPPRDHPAAEREPIRRSTKPAHPAHGGSPPPCAGRVRQWLDAAPAAIAMGPRLNASRCTGILPSDSKPPGSVAIDGFKVTSAWWPRSLELRIRSCGATPAHGWTRATELPNVWGALVEVGCCQRACLAGEPHDGTTACISQRGSHDRPVRWTLWPRTRDMLAAIESALTTSTPSGSSPANRGWCAWWP